MLDSFRSRYRLRPPRIVHTIRQELVQLQFEDEIRLLNNPAPAINILYGVPPSSSTETVNRYLWVIDTRGIPYIFEAPIPAIGCALPKHTNLTGGAEAYVGGEMWFTSEVNLYISGGSGRYSPIDGNQLEEAVQVFRSFDYEVTSLGWNYNTGLARRVLEVT